MNTPYSFEETLLFQASSDSPVPDAYRHRVRHLALSQFRALSSARSLFFRRLLAPLFATTAAAFGLFVFFVPLTQAYEVDPASGTIVERIRGEDSTLLQFEDTVRPGDILRTGSGQSRFAAHLGTATVDVFSHSQIHVLGSEEASIVAGLLSLSTQDTFTLRTPQGVVLLAPNSLARIEVSPLQDVSVRLRSGSAEFITSGGTLTLAPGRSVRLFPDTDVGSLLPYFSARSL